MPQTSDADVATAVDAAITAVKNGGLAVNPN
jgi:hypothetical protein